MGINSGHRARVPMGRAASDTESSWGVASKGLSDGNASGLPPVPPSSPPSTPQLRPPPTTTAATGGREPVCTATGVNQSEHTRIPCILQATLVASNAPRVLLRFRRHCRDMRD